MTVRLDDNLRNDIHIFGMPNFGTGTLKIYTGVQPGSANDVVSGTLLATFILAGFNAPVSGVRGLNSIALIQPILAVATGIAGWARMTSTDGTPRKIDFAVTVTGGGGDITINNTSIVTNDDVSITSFDITMPGG